MAMSEPVVLHHGLAGGGASRDEARPAASMACWAAVVSGGVTCTLACLVVGSTHARESRGALAGIQAATLHDCRQACSPRREPSR